MVSSKNIELIDKQKKIRQCILKIAMQDLNNGAHLGGALSSVEIISTIYDSFINENNKFILSKGHASLALYSTLFVEGILSQQDLESYHKLGTFLLGHPVKNKDKGIEFSTGSLGLGLSLSSGLAYLYRRQNISRKVFCLVGDGELDEGSNWEALKFAQHHELSNLICLIDNNGFQQTGSKSEISNFKFAPSFFDKLGWEAAEVDGHSNLELFQSITNLINSKISKPKVIICNTIKGKGIKLMENNNDYHHKMITQSSYEEFLKII